MVDGEDFRPVITVVDITPEPWMTAATVSQLRGWFDILRRQSGGYPHSPKCIIMGGVGVKVS